MLTVMDTYMASFAEKIVCILVRQTSAFVVTPTILHNGKSDTILSYRCRENYRFLRLFENQFRFLMPFEKTYPISEASRKTYPISEAFRKP